MDVNQVLHMNGAAGEYSYAHNSTVQNDIISMTKPYTEQALVELLSGGGATMEGKIGIADLGCSSGPNTLAAMSHMLEVVYDTWQKKGGKSPEVAFYLNDLPGNDFNYLFESLPGFLGKLREEKGDEFGPWFVFGAPGSFYGRLFPTQSLHFVHSSTSLHWLSKTPQGLDPKTRPTLNKGKINISKTSSKEIVEAYKKQFKNDFSSFLESRSKEVVAEGRMVLTIPGSGIVQEEKVDSFNMPIYTPCPDEIKHLVQTQGSFKIDRLQPSTINYYGRHETDSVQSESRGEKMARIYRAVFEPILEFHFGKSIMDELFHRYGMDLDSYYATREPKLINLTVTMVRKHMEFDNAF